MTNKNIYISARDVAEDAKLNHEIAEELRRYKINHQLSCQCPTLASRSNKDSLTTWILRSSRSMTRMYVLLSILTLLPTLTHAETCTPTPKCEDLGYNQSSCPDGGGVKCPWNTSLLYCGENGKKICTDMGYPYSCTGTNESPSGKACANKYYTICTCSSGYEWKNGKCEKATKTCAVGDVLYADKKCYPNPPSLSPIGVVFSSGKAVALSDLSGTMTWSNANLQSSSYSAGGITGWHLPTKDELLAVYNNKSAVSSGLTAAEGSQFTSNLYWSSVTPDYTSRYYVVNPVSGNASYSSTDYGHYVRPVLAF